MSDEQGNQITFPSQSEADASLCTVLALDFMRAGTPEGDEIQGDELEAMIGAEFRKRFYFAMRRVEASVRNICATPSKKGSSLLSSIKRE